MYLDPPYNHRQYATNYHMLETIAKYDNPKIHGKTGLREYQNQKSLYCSRSQVKKAFKDLILAVRAKYIFLSYNNEGLMTLIIEAEKEEEEKIVIESGYIGKGGEHLVCSELLFRGFNASIMSVDVGVDISAIQDNKFFGIQVKTARKNSFDTYPFHIRKKSFDRFNQGNIFYILVLRDGTNNSFLILPSNEIEKKIKEKAIFTVRSLRLFTKVP